MAAPTFRDRLLTREGARAIMSPVGIVLGLALAAIAVAAGLPVWAAVLAGIGLWALNAVRLLPRRPRPERIDPFTLHEPWRRFVQEALQARTRFAEAVHRTPPGPLRDRLREISERMQTGVEECWHIAKRGQTLVTARRGIDLAAVERRLDAARDATDAGDTTAVAITRSLEAQRATAERLDEVISRAQVELRLLDARFDEAVARTLELSAHASAEASAGVIGLGADIDDLVTEMEALRRALDETTTSAAALPGASGGGPAPGASSPETRRDVPPGDLG
jgi:hypothetical protein